MTAVASIVQTATQDLTPADAKVPGFLSVVFSGIHKVHRLWRWYRKGEIYTNPDNFAKLIAGHAVNFVLGENIVLRVAAQCVLISTRILDCVEQQVSLYRGCRKWVNTLRGRFVHHKKTQWSKDPSAGLISPSTRQWWSSTLRNLLHRIKCLAVRTFKIFKRLFKLSMHTMDAVDSFSLSPETKNESINELFVNGTKWLDKLVENKELLLNGLKENKHIIQKILSGLHSNFKVEQLIDAVSTSLEKTEKVYNGAKKVANFAGGILKDLVKQSLWGFMQALGLTEYTPLWLVPPLDPPWVTDNGKPNLGRYPPITWVSKKINTQQIPSPLALQIKEVKPTDSVIIPPSTKKSLPTYVLPPNKRVTFNKGKKLVQSKESHTYADLITAGQFQAIRV